MRIRTIKPEFWMHEGLCKCSEFTRLLAIALLNWSDDEGYFMANPILIRGQVFPFLDDSKMIPRSLKDLSSVGWIALGRDDQGRDVGMIKNFAKHQRVDKPKPSIIKANSQFQDESKMNPRIVPDASKEEGKGREQGMEEDGNMKESLPLPFRSYEFAEAWNDWVQFRKSKRKPVSERSMAISFADFIKWGEAASIASIQSSIKNDYQGLFCPKLIQEKRVGGKHAGISSMNFDDGKIPF